jgi:DNA-binding transcriptional regulator of glucitol operon
MLCFNGPQLTKYKPALRQLSDKGFVVKEKFKGGYSLTNSGFAAMKECKS